MIPRYGAAGMASTYQLRRIIPPDELFPVPQNGSAPPALSPNNSWTFHRAFGAVGLGGEEWLSRASYLALFGGGALDSLEKEVRASQFAQAEGLRYANQAHRRSWPHRSLSAYWMLNEPWPNAAYGSTIEFFGGVKHAFYTAVRKVYANVDVSLRYDQLCFQEGAALPVSVWVVSDCSEDGFGGGDGDGMILAMTMVRPRTGDVLRAEEWSVRLGRGTSVQKIAAKLRDFTLPTVEQCPECLDTGVLVRLRLRRSSSSDHLPINLDYSVSQRTTASDEILSEQVYTFGVLRKGADRDRWERPPFAGLLNPGFLLGAPPRKKNSTIGVSSSPGRGEQEDSTLEIAVARTARTADHFTVTLRNRSPAPALFTELKLLNREGEESDQFHPALFADNFFVVFGGETFLTEVRLLEGGTRRESSGEGPDSVCATAWNYAERVCAGLYVDVGAGGLQGRAERASGRAGQEEVLFV